MTTDTVSPSLPTLGARTRTGAVQGAPALLALVALVVILVLAAVNQPGILSVSGLTIMLMSAVPLVFAAQAQMIVMAVGDIDLSVGYLVGLVTVVAATMLAEDPVLGAAVLAGLVASYALLGAVIQVRKVPSIIVTLGMSFVWLGVGLQMLPTPGGAAPAWLAALGSWRPSWVPAPVALIALATLAGWYVVRRSRAGMRMRALGSDAVTLDKSGHSLVATRVLAYAVAAVLAVTAGLLLASQTRSGDVNAANSFTLMSIAAVILGGGNFSGGRALPVGVTLGAVTLALITVLLSLVNLPSSFQAGAQGLIVLAVLAGRVITERFAR